MRRPQQVNDKRVYLTQDGKTRLEEELRHLTSVKRREVAEKIHAAKEEGDILENSAYDEAKNEQAFLEGRIRTLEAMLKNAVVIDQDGQGDRVGLGAYVTLEDEQGRLETFRIVGSAEADPNSGLISNVSPVGKALLGRREGETVSVVTPGGELWLKVRAVRWTSESP